MNKIGKYEFDSLEQAEDKITALGVATDDDGNTYPTHKHCIVKLGYIVLEKGEYNEEGEEVKAPVLSDKYHLDVLWKGLEPVDAEAEALSYVEPNDWADDRVVIEGNGVHSFMGLDYQEYKF